MTFKNNIKLLNSYKSRSNKNNDKIDSVIRLYQEKKIPNMKTAENAIVLVSSKHKATIPKALDNYDKLVNKYIEAEPMTGRLSRPDFTTVSTKSLDNPKTHIQFDIRTSNHSRFDKVEAGDEQVPIGDVFNTIKTKVIQQVATVLSHKQSTKIKLGANFRIAYINTDPFQDDSTQSAKDSLNVFIRLLLEITALKIIPCLRKNKENSFK